MNADRLHYALVIEWSDEDQAYVVTAPELPGCRTHGFTYEEALAQGKDAIESWLDARRASGRPIPEPHGVPMPVGVALPPSFKRWLAATERPDEVRIRYHRSSDTLTIALGNPTHTHALDGDGVILEIETETHEFVGLEIRHCRQAFLPKHPEFWLSYLLATSRLFSVIVRIGLWLVRREPGADRTIASDTAMRVVWTATKGISTAA